LDLGRSNECENEARVVVLERKRSLVERVVGRRSQPETWEMVSPSLSRPVPALKVSSPADQPGSGHMEGGHRGEQSGERILKPSLTMPWDDQSEEMVMNLPIHPLIMNYSSPIDMEHEVPSQRRTKSFNPAEYTV